MFHTLNQNFQKLNMKKDDFILESIQFIQNTLKRKPYCSISI